LHVTRRTPNAERLSSEAPKQAGHHSSAVRTAIPQLSKVFLSDAVEGFNELQNGFQLVQRTSGDVHVSPKVAVSHAARALREIEGYAIGGAPPLRGQCISLIRW